MKDKTFAPFLNYLFKAFPDLHYTIANNIAEGDKVTVSCTIIGTHEGELFGAPANGNKMKYKEMVLYKMSNGKIVECWAIADVYGLQQQLKKK